MQIFNTRETWLIALTDAEIISVTANILHNKNNGIVPTKEEKLKALNYYQDKLLKDHCLDKEIKKVREYESANKKECSKKGSTEKKRNRASKRRIRL